MKKVLLAASLFISAATFAGYNHANTVNTTVDAGGNHIPASQVPAAVKATFISMFPGAANVRWQVEREHGQVVYQADFQLHGQRWRAVFSADGTFVKGGAH